MPFLKDVLPETDPFVVSRDWIEATENTQPGGGDVMSMQDAEAVIVVETVPSKIRSMIRVVLGFSFADETNEKTNGVSVARLHRENPLRHPRYPWMRATTIAFSQFPPGDTALQTIKRNALFPAGGPGEIKFYAAYQKVYATVRFRPQRCQFLEDSQITTNVEEQFRNVFWDSVGETSMLSAEGPLGQCVWAETGAGGPPILQAIKQPFGTLVEKTDFTLNWLMVPHEWVSSTPYPLPFFKNIVGIAGRVNSVQFGRFLPGELLAGGVKATPFQWQISTKTGRDGFYGWNLSIPFKRFSPDKGVVSAARGWQLLPWPLNGLWYRVVRGSGATFLPETDFNIIWEKATP